MLCIAVCRPYTCFPGARKIVKCPRTTINLLRPHQCDSEGGRIRGVLVLQVCECQLCGWHIFVACSLSMDMSRIGASTYVRLN